MCLITFSWQPGTPTPLVMLANRDEYYDRPTLVLHDWDDYPMILGGRDLVGKGSWLAFSRTGRFATVTNFREIPFKEGKISRGKLVSHFLCGNDSALTFLTQLEKEAADYAGFNLLIGDTTGIYYFSNRGGRARTLAPGLYGLSNHLLDTPWPKLEKAKTGLSAILKQPGLWDCAVERIMGVMQHTSRLDDGVLPNTGVSLDEAYLRASCFIHSDHYGTRNTSFIRVNAQGYLEWREQLYGAKGVKQAMLSRSVQWLPKLQGTVFPAEKIQFSKRSASAAKL